MKLLQTNQHYGMHCSNMAHIIASVFADLGPAGEAIANLGDPSDPVLHIHHDKEQAIGKANDKDIELLTKKARAAVNLYIDLCTPYGDDDTQITHTITTNPQD